MTERRVCASPGCGTILSAYNNADRCALHGGGARPIDYFLADSISRDLRVEEWEDDAACRGADPERFDVDLPSSGEMTEPVAGAKRVCAYCPVRRECLDFAFRHDWYAEMVYGGLTGRQRASLRDRPDRLDAGAALFMVEQVKHGLYVLWKGAAA